MRRCGALVVIDMQNDYLWQQRKPMFSYETDTLVAAVNEAIHTYQSRGYEIIYLAQVFPDLVTNRWFIGHSIRGTSGAKLYGELDVVSDFFFEKNLPSAFSSRPFREYVKKQELTDLFLCGLDECGCVMATAKAAAKRGLRVSILRSATASRFSEEAVQKMRRKLIARGVSYIENEAFLPGPFGAG